MRDLIITEEIRQEVLSILTDILGKDATGIYTTVEEIEGGGYGDFYSTLKYENGRAVNYGNFIEETDDVCFYNGASRFIIYPYNTEYVIKLPITHVYDERIVLRRPSEEEEGTYDYNECWGSSGDADFLLEEGYEIIGREFACNCSRTSFDLMEQENAYYEEAKEVSESTADILLPNEYIGNFNDIPVWVQRKIRTTQSDLCDDNTASPEEKESLSKIEDKSTLNNSFILALIRKYGEKLCEEIINTINYLGLNDLHGGNIGYLFDGSPVIFDFAGYDEDEIWNYDVVLN